MDNKTREKMRISHLGKTLTEETKRKISEKHKGKPLSEEHKRKIGIKSKGRKYPNRKMSEEAKKRLREIGVIGGRGENAPHWKGGITPINKKIRNSIKYKEWRQRIFIRDDFTCPKCEQRGGDLEAHHHRKSFSRLWQEARKNLPLFDSYEAAMVYTPLWDTDNGITLCEKCHNSTKGKSINSRKFKNVF